MEFNLEWFGSPHIAAKRNGAVDSRLFCGEVFLGGIRKILNSENPYQIYFAFESEREEQSFAGIATAIRYVEKESNKFLQKLSFRPY